MAEEEEDEGAMTSLVSVAFERQALATHGHIEEVSTHYRDLLRDGSPQEAAWYAGMQGNHGEIVSIETAAMKRSRDFLLMLADEMARKRGRRIYRKAFVNWRVHVFRYIFLREQILQNYTLNTYLARRFYAWRLAARRGAALAMCVRQCWRRRRRHRFSWWKLCARWRSLRLRLCLRVFRAMKDNAKLQYAVGRRWKAIGRHKREDFAARKIQAVQRWHAPRRNYWAQRTIKIWVMSYLSLRFLRRRGREERRRAAFEQETSDILIRRALENLDGLLNDEGNVILTQYLSSVNGVAKQIEAAPPGSLLCEAKLFPSAKDAPELAKMWTVRAKAMAVLRMRCTAEVVRLARRRFRQSSPPIYECLRCAATFTVRKDKLHHLQLACPLRRPDDNLDDDEDDEDVDDEEEGVDEGKGRDDHDSTEGGDQFDAEADTGIARKKGKRKPLKSTFKWRQRQKARAKGFRVPADCADELERDYICWKLAAPIVEAALQPLAAYLASKHKPHPRGTAFVTKR